MGTVAGLAIDSLRRLGVDTLFCVPGVQNDDFFDALFDATDIRPIVCRHEQGAAYLAMGAAQATGAPAAFCVVPGPGMLNSTGALTSAYWGGARVYGLIGAVPSQVRGRHLGVLHDLDDPAAVLAQVTKHTGLVNDPADAAPVFQTAIDELVSGAAHPVTVEVPANLWRRDAPGRVEPPTVTRPELDPDQVERVAAVIADAHRPVIVVGGGAQDASESVTRLAELLGAPVTTRRMGHGVIDARHRLQVPLTIGHSLWEKADVVIGIGSRIEFPIDWWGTDDDMQIVQIDIEAEAIDRRGVGAIGIHGDADEAVRALLDRLADDGVGAADLTDELEVLRAEFDDQTAHLEPQRSYVAAIREALPDDGVLVEDVTQIGFACQLFFEHRHPRSYLASGPAGTLGSAVAVGIGAQYALGDRPVVSIVGDGGFLFTAPELATAVQHDIPTTVLLFNDGAYGNVRRMQQQKFGPDRTIASTLRNPDHVKFAESTGVRAERIDSPGQLVPALTGAITHDGPSLVEVMVGEMPDPWPFFRPSRIRGSGRE
jgi:acetolactate synthase-1/2/3 large subunit